MAKKIKKQLKEEEEEKEKPKTKEGPIDVFDRNGQYVRTFDEDQGKDYEEKAKEFIYAGNKKANADTDENPVPWIARKREMRPHDFRIKKADVVDEKGFIRKSFTRKEYGIHFIEMALASFNKQFGLPDTGSPNRDEWKPDRFIKCRVELRKEE